MFRRYLSAVRYRSEALVKDLLYHLVVRRRALPPEVAGKRVILVGASVGQGWRLHQVYPGCRALAHYGFDKSALIRRAIGGRPDGILIKECAAYFPSPEVNPELLLRWIQQIRAASIRPLLATVVPVTRAHAHAHPGRLEGLCAFNDGLRELAHAEDVPLLDLEVALRCSAEDRHLDPRFAQADGIHLRFAAYRQRLDPLIPALLQQAFVAGVPSIDLAGAGR